MPASNKMSSIIAIYDLGPGYVERYTIVTSSISPVSHKYRALVIDENADGKDMLPYYEDFNVKSGISTKDRYGDRISYVDLPKPVQDYLNQWNILPEDPVFEVPCPGKMYSPENIKKIADETLEYLCKEYPYERNTYMRAAFEMFAAEIISRTR